MNFGQFFGTIILGKIFSPVYQKAAYAMCQECEPFIEKGSRILDLGCGRGIVSQALKDYFEGEVFGIDIKDQRVIKNFPFQVYNGKNLFFNDNSFDVVFISYVFHHTQNLEELLAEAKRVTRDKIIIYEDLPEGISGKLGNFLHQITYDIFFSLSKETFNFRRIEDWLDIFQNLDLKIISKKKAKTWFNWIYPHKSIFFVLAKK